MTKRMLHAALLLLLTTGSVYAHDMFLEIETHFLSPNAAATFALVNGTFGVSENVISRDRMQDVRVVGPGNEGSHPDLSQWWDDESTSRLNLRTGEAGTYVIGVSTRPNMIELTAAEFNEYLEHDGVLDTLEKRRHDGTADTAANERYSKHVKAIYQVGDERTDAYGHRLGYPIEIVPLANPYELGPGDALGLLVLRGGEPVADQLVYASYAGYHGHDDEGGHVVAVQTRTDADGVATIELASAGRWYVRLIHMVEIDDEPGVTHESNWATLTFEIR